MLAFNFNNVRSTTRNLISGDRIADPGNQITWVVHSYDPFSPFAPSIE
jgi:hypothetical protein